MPDGKLQTRNMFLLFIAASIWGSAFVAQRVGMDYVGPFTFNGSRSIIGGIVLLPFVFHNLRKRKKEYMDAGSALEYKRNNHLLILGGILCGICLCSASNLQQIGIKYTTSVGKSGFITACYIILVPVIQMWIGKYKEKRPGKLSWYPVKHIGKIVWIAVCLAVVGLYLLCMNERLSLDYADILVLICAILFSIHILIIDYFSPLVDGVTMSCIQFFICGFLSMGIALVSEQISLEMLLAGWMPVLYAGALSSGVAYTLQIVGQKDVNPTIASLILSLESAISVIAAWLFLGQRMSMREIAGCLIMLVAIVIVQLPSKQDTKTAS